MNDHAYPQNSPVLAVGETILWRGKPKKFAYIATKSLTLLPIALIWLALDMNFISGALQDGELLWFLIPFFSLHLMPVWLWLASTLTAGKRWKNTAYFVTNRRIILQRGFFAVEEVSVFYKDLRNVQTHIGPLDKLFHTGDILLDDGIPTRGNSRSNQSSDLALEDLEDVHEVYRRIHQIILDIQTDMEYPNALRPAENPGYQTNYRD